MEACSQISRMCTKPRLQKPLSAFHQAERHGLNLQTSGSPRNPTQISPVILFMGRSTVWWITVTRQMSSLSNQCRLSLMLCPHPTTGHLLPSHMLPKQPISWPKHALTWSLSCSTTHAPVFLSPNQKCIVVEINYHRVQETLLAPPSMKSPPACQHYQTSVRGGFRQLLNCTNLNANLAFTGLWRKTVVQNQPMNVSNLRNS